MDLRKFNELCQAKWDDGRGDVQELYLREESFDELFKDILVNRTRPVSLLNIRALLNPATRSEVVIKTTTANDFTVTYFRGGRKERTDIDDISDSR